MRRSVRSVGEEAVVAAALAVQLVAAGCDAGLISTTGRRELTDAGAVERDATASDAGSLSAREVFERDARPLFTMRCATCHGDGGTSTAPDFLAARPSMYDNLVGWPALVDRRVPDDSRVLTKGRHDGPAWTSAEAATVRTWLEAEAAEADPVEATPCTALRTVEVGAGSLDLGVFGLRGSAVTFAASRVSSTAMFLSDLRIVAGEGGVHAVHPVFVSWVAGAPHTPTLDPFAGTDFTVMPGASEDLLGTGGISLVDFPAGSQISVCFDSVDSTTGGSTGGGADGGVPAGDGGAGTMPPAGGCSAVDAFTTYARPQFVRYCTSCHAGSRPTATAALDMTMMSTTSATAQATACAQVLSRVNRTSLMSSAIFVQPDPTGPATSHDFHFDTTTARDAFKAQILLWVTMEP
jgi:mono/diheme cytochrome c family protein